MRAGAVGLVAAVLVAAAGLLGWAVPAWIAAALALAVLGIQGLTAGRVPAEPDAVPAPVPIPVEPAAKPGTGRTDDLVAAIGHLEAALHELRDRAATPDVLKFDANIRALMEGMVGYSRVVVYAAVVDPALAQRP